MSKIDGKILVLDDDQGVLYTAKMILKQHFETVITEKDPQKLDFLLNQDRYDVIVLDMNFSYGLTSGKEGIKLLRKVLEKDPEAHVLMNTAYGDIDIAVEAMKEGAVDFLVKPWQKEKLLATVTAIYELSQAKRKLALAEAGQKIVVKDQQREFNDIISVSPAMKPVFEAIDKVAKTDANVLILGENGTGKELIARAIHNKSNRVDENFIKVDLGAVSESLFQSELFGHVKGAFTDARENRPGRFEIANKGTLFLDEIGNLSLSMQAKLLTAIQFKQITRVGSNKAIPLDTRLICATNMPLYEMVEEKEFRQDLLYRINTVEIKLPPLRERVEDIEPLARHFLKLYGKKYKKQRMRLNETTLTKLKAYSWPGNVRELQHAIERAIIMSNSHLLAPEDFLLVERPNQNVITSDTFNMEDMEKQAIQNAIRNAEGNLTKAAKALGLGRSTLYRKMEKYKL
ncbi:MULTISPECIES: sigma-54-dependent transcriptional regulator [Roseivirga]|jgi:DNA-binding NtrC family response regulator|uniref:AAA family ATPase n=1 Tax=Roseivirga spongicola TaxID=333140 RepID=A0A150X3T4_9BACT|nr:MULTISPECIES: sigma-54 dependent transcriptional regulator [Roseivirga]KYG73379.1 AAA family ATPase [Roseivirga spongicola]MBO6497739.1 sigma-54-dependent Fis family transcriptional regulator [Roseivirga sp.]MBO6659627.1 sigma-54-dependent Fis family transcriptional regulator [Roseivirga sp.]MBO6759511.1 sigma-54-dependent Fis family transcriptional regulator [Roseivirga sp.]MBO6907636.1 sigma-54-dependent Fis family transcriptional regulator [Roseivirga sp.]